MSQEVSPDYNPEALEAYSCSRCRKLKKKCPRQLPQCNNCVKAREVCHYPGRAPRRTKKELREAIMRGEVLPSMKRKNKRSFRELTTADLRNLENWDDPMGYNKSADHAANMPMGNTVTAVGGSLGAPPPHLSVNPLPPGILPHSLPIGNPPQMAGNTIVGTPMTTTSDPGQQPHISFGTDAFGNRTAYSLVPPAQKARIVLDQNPKFVNAQSAFKANEINIPVTSPHVANQVFPEGVSSLISALNTMNDNVSANTPIALSYLQLQKLHQQQQHLQQQEQQQQQILQQQLQQQHQQQMHQQQLQQQQQGLPDAGNIAHPLNAGVYPTIPGQRTTPGPPTFPIPAQTVVPPQLSQQQQEQQQNSHSFPTSPFETKERPSYGTSVLNNLHQVSPFPSKTKEENMADSDSVPIDSASIAYEVIQSKYNGSKASNWSHEDGSYKPIGRELLDRFIAAYFKHNHRLFPMIDKISLSNEVTSIKNLEQVDKLEASNPSLSKAFIFQLQMIMAIGCTTLQRAGMLTEIEENLCEHLSFLAMKNFRHVLELQDLETVKCLLLLGIYSFFEPKGVSSWTISGITMRLVIELGLNRPLTAKKMTTMSAMDVESRYRVFWSAYCYERVVATSLGRISAIDDEDVGVPLPRALYDSELEDIEVSNMIISLRKMGGKIYKEVHSVSAGRKNLSMEEKQAIISKLRQELDCIYNAECEKRKLNTTAKLTDPNSSENSFKREVMGTTPAQSAHNESVGSVLSPNSEFSTNGLHSRHMHIMTPSADSPMANSIPHSGHSQNSSIVATPSAGETPENTQNPSTTATLTNNNDLATSSTTITKDNNNDKTTRDDSPSNKNERMGSNESGKLVTDSNAETTSHPTEDEMNPPTTVGKLNGKNTHEISFHTSDVWLAMRYSQLQILLYRPSALIPKPPLESLTILGEFCLEAWKHTYTLYKKKLLPLNWITLFRTLTICNTILYCLCQWSIDLVASAMEIQQCVEILKHFGAKWVFAMKCADVFQNISNTIVDISLAHGQVPNIDKLTRELFGASDAYQDILDQNNVDVSWLDRIP